jgi:AcrR family transcriptional regulator
VEKDTVEKTDSRRTNTREQIRTVALEMFAERGYEGTSLREIAERLGVTKAAVYYHFKTKEDILASLVTDFLGQLDELIAWAQGQPAGPATHRALLERYSALLSGPASELAQFMQQGQPALKDLAAGLKLRDRFALMVPLLVDGAATPAAALRAQVALISLHVGAFGPPHMDPLTGADLAERRAEALRIAFDVLGC